MQQLSTSRTFDEVLVDLNAFRRIVRRLLPLVQPCVRSAGAKKQRQDARQQQLVETTQKILLECAGDKPTRAVVTTPR